MCWSLRCATGNMNVKASTNGFGVCALINESSCMKIVTHPYLIDNGHTSKDQLAFHHGTAKPSNFPTTTLNEQHLPTSLPPASSPTLKFLSNQQT